VIWLVVGSLVPSFLVSLSIAFLIRRIAPKIGLVDRPGQHKAHAAPTPMGGGLAIWAGVVLPLVVGWFSLAWLVVRYSSPLTGRTPEPGSIADFVLPHVEGLLHQAPRLLTLMVAATVLVLLGLIDDMRGLKWWLRFIVQWLVAAFMVAQGWQMSLFIDFPPLTFLASVIWIVALINTFNMLDNMDGLAAGVAAIAAAILAAVILTAPESFTQGPQLFVGGFLLVLVGSLLGFLWHNRPPAKLFMGDAGSYFVGFCLATSTISATFAGGNLPRHAILAPLCVLAVPIYDTVTVIVIRLSEGRSPFSADRNHLSHRLVDLGLTKSQAVLVIYAATGVCGLGAFLLHKVNTLTAIGILVGVALLLAVIARVELAARKKKMTNV
jgi:UDP-GlcNAc:undecaprenyl-phosphate GlcNAc-1-phosphate transferase